MVLKPGQIKWFKNLGGECGQNKIVCSLREETETAHQNTSKAPGTLGT